jgi:hypothetical protein
MIIDLNLEAIGVVTTAQSILLPMAALFFGAIVLAYMCLMLVLMNTDHTLLSLLKMNAGRKSRPPVAPFGMFECIHNMTSDQQPWFPLHARKALDDTDTFVLPLPRRPVMTGDFALAREILTDPLSIKPRTYQEFEPLGVGSIFTRNGPYWVSKSEERYYECHSICLVSVILSNRCCICFRFEIFVYTLDRTAARATKGSGTGLFQSTRQANEPGGPRHDRKMDPRRPHTLHKGGTIL